MDLSKAFDTINPDLLIAKLHAYEFSKDSLILIKSYLSNHWRRTRVNLNFSSWSKLTLLEYVKDLYLDLYSSTSI